jgi:hypothetical protein
MQDPPSSQSRIEKHMISSQKFIVRKWIQDQQAQLSRETKDEREKERDRER